MKKIQRSDLYSLEKYAEIRQEFRSNVMVHKKNRRLSIGPNITLHFEDRLTIQYQIQEMLRTERIFEAAGIEEELAAYNPLIPDGQNWKATMMIEFDDPVERAKYLADMVGIEDTIWMQVNDLDRIIPFSDEDMERTTEAKTSAVHFLRFELNKTMISKLKQGAPIMAGIEHQNYRYTINPLPDTVCKALLEDLE